MPEDFASHAHGGPIAIVGVACRFPDAAGAAQFLDLFLTGRRAFRRLPPVRFTGGEEERHRPGDAGTGRQLGAAGLHTAPSGTLATGATTGSAGLAGPVRAALIEGWKFDRAAFGVSEAAYRAADPAHWLALETAARALADGGFPGGQGLTRDRTGVIIGNTLTGEVSRATTMRARWPYFRRVLSTALAAGDIPAEAHAEVIERAAASFLAPLPDIRADSLAGSLPSAIADRICGHFGFRGGGHAVDSAHSSSLLAVAAACSALAAGDLDAAVAGGVDVSLDPFEITGLAQTGVLADNEMRVFDTRPTGFWPGEGCGLVVLMRAADARAANVPIYAEIAGWGVSSAGSPALTRPGSGSLLLALRRAYQRARVDPADVQLIEGDGTGTASGDLAELTSLAEIRAGSPSLAALGSIKANIGHTKAAAGVAGLIKATLAVSSGVIPPATGCVRPHALIANEDARVRAPRTAEEWPEGIRLAGVSAVGPGGTSVHLVLRRHPQGRLRRISVPGRSQTDAIARPHEARSPGPLIVTPTPRTEAFVFSAPDRQTLTAELNRVADIAQWLSEAEFHDLACDAARRAETPGRIRMSLVASTPDQLSALARDAVGMMPGMRPGRLAASPGIFGSDGGRSRVALLFPGEGAFLTAVSRTPTGGQEGYDPALHPAILAASLAGLRWLDQLGVVAVAGVGHGLGEITGLTWAGCLSEQDAARLVSQRAAVLGTPSASRSALVCVDADARSAQAFCRGTDLVLAADNGPRCQILAGPVAAVRELTSRLAEDGVPARVLDAPAAFYSPAMADHVPPLRGVLREVAFHPPSRRLLSTVTGTGLSAHDDISELLCAQLTSPIRFAGPLSLAAREADLLVETGPGQGLSLLAADCCDVPAVSLAGGRNDEEAAARAVAALFAAGAVRSLLPLFSGRTARPIDIWRERTFIASPLGSGLPAGLRAATMAGGERRPRPPAPAAGGRTAGGASPSPASAPPAPPASTQAAVPGRPAAPAAHDRSSAGPASGASPANSTIPGREGAAGDRSSRQPAAGSPAANRPSRREPGGAGLSGSASAVEAAGSAAAPGAAPATPPEAGTEQGPASREGSAPGRPARGHVTPARGRPARAHASQAGTNRAGTSPTDATPPAPEPADATPPQPAPSGSASADSAPPDAMTDNASPPLAAGAVRSEDPARTPGTPAVAAPAGWGARWPRLTWPSRGRTDAAPPPGIAPWVRVFTGRLVPAPFPDASRQPGPWRVRTASHQPFGQMADGLFRNDAKADCVLAVLADPAEPGGCATLLDAAREAVTAGRLVVITSVPGLAGFCASLRAEHPSLGVTVIQVPENPAGLRAARQFATADPGSLREFQIDDTGAAHELVMTALRPPADGPFPLGPPDVVLVSGVTGVGDLACAASLTSRGAALAVIAPPGPEDPSMSSYLNELRTSGVRVSRKKADPTDPGQMAAAVRSLERALGPVTAIVQAAAPGPIERCIRLPEATVRTQLASQRAKLSNLLAAVAMERVRLLLTFGSVSARYGRPEGACGALLSGMLPGQASRLASAWSRCRLVHVDLPGWLAPSAGDPGGPTPPDRPVEPVVPAWNVAPIPISNASELLRSVLASPDFPARTAIHGRAGTGGPAPTGQAAATGGRFLEAIRLHYPGIELICETRLSLSTDPYIADYRIDGLLVLPASVALEAMAQAAGALVGEPIRDVTGFAAPAPVVLPPGSGGTVIRICALNRGDVVESVLRSAETGFRVDHARATFRPASPTAPPAPGAVEPAGGDSGSAGIVDGTDLYGPIYFQTGRFRRVAFLPEVTSWSLRALVRGGDDQPWFGPVAGTVDGPLILGSPGLNDATLHVLQACAPHRRVLPAGCESVTFSGREVRGALQIHAERRSTAPTADRLTSGGKKAGQPTRHEPAAEAATVLPAARLTQSRLTSEVWDVTAVDATGELVSVWTGVRLEDLGPLSRTGPWHPALLAVCLERRAAEFGLDPALSAVVSVGTARAGSAERAGAARSPSGSPSPSTPPASAPSPASVAARPAAASSPSAAPCSTAPRMSAAEGEGRALAAASRWSDAAVGRGPLDGFELSVGASRPVACSWEAVGRPPLAVLNDPAYHRLRHKLASTAPEGEPALTARLHTLITCFAALGREPGTPLVLDDACDGGWVLVRGAGIAAACVVVEIGGVPAPVAVAIATRAAP